MKDYSTLDVSRILSIPRERFREWMKAGFIRPTAQVPSGSGTRALFNLTDLYRITLFRNLLEHVHLDRINAAVCVGSLRDQDLRNRNFAAFRTDIMRIHQRINAKTREVEDVTEDVSWRVVQTFDESQRFNFKDMDNVLILNLEKVRQYVKELLKE